MVDDQNGKKVINPINDLNSKPDINELLAKEQARAGLVTPPATSIVSPTTPTAEPQLQNKPTIINSELAPTPAPDPNDNIAL
ncbi:MAG: hypothetical protein AAB914_03470 [Patescibacteria group bacterium]